MGDFESDPGDDDLDLDLDDKLFGHVECGKPLKAAMIRTVRQMTVDAVKLVTNPEATARATSTPALSEDAQDGKRGSTTIQKNQKKKTSGADKDPKCLPDANRILAMTPPSSEGSNGRTRDWSVSKPISRSAETRIPES